MLNNSLRKSDMRQRRCGYPKRVILNHFAPQGITIDKTSKHISLVQYNVLKNKTRNGSLQCRIIACARGTQPKSPTLIGSTCKTSKQRKNYYNATPRHKYL